ncbi:MAG: (2Fe-2S)-binding protein [Pseudomonadota bacterium]|jgi:Rieske Fe-S protein
MERREFMRICAASAAAAAGVPALAAAGATAQLYARVQLVDGRGEPLRAGSVPVRRSLIFHYPYTATPCFLLNLGRPAKASARLRTADRRDYEWRGGVGPQRSIVAYSAICAHQLAYPTKEISFISFRAETSARNRHADVIHCCAEHSQYDPADGARVVAGPAPQPLAAILLEHDPASDTLYAVGTLGGEMFQQFFAKYAMRLALENGDAGKREVSGTAAVVPLEQYCRQQVKC